MSSLSFGSCHCSRTEVSVSLMAMTEWGGGGTAKGNQVRFNPSKQTEAIYELIEHSISSMCSLKFTHDNF